MIFMWLVNHWLLNQFGLLPPVDLASALWNEFNRQSEQFKSEHVDQMCCETDNASIDVFNCRTKTAQKDFSNEPISGLFQPRGVT